MAVALPADPGWRISWRPPGPDLILTLECSLLSALDSTEAELLKTCFGTDSSLVVPSAGRLLPVFL
jgi:hypothetical protein